MSEQKKPDDERAPPKHSRFTWNPNPTSTSSRSTARPENTQRDRHIIILRPPAVQDTELPVSFEEFWENTNIAKIAEFELKRQHPMCYKEMLKNEDSLKTLALDYYRIHYVKPEYRTFKPLYYFYVKATCPPEIRRRMFKKFKSNRNGSNVSTASRTNARRKVCRKNGLVQMDSSELFKVPRKPRKKTEKCITADSDSDSNDEIDFGENSGSTEQYIGLEARPSAKSIEHFSPPVPNTTSDASAGKSEKYSQMFLAKDAYIAVLESVFPVCYSVFKEFSSYNDIIVAIKKKITNELKYELEPIKAIGHRIFHNYYKQFYLNPTVRQEFPYIFSETCPEYLRRKILETPRISELRRKIMLESRSCRSDIEAYL